MNADVGGRPNVMSDREQVTSAELRRLTLANLPGVAVLLFDPDLRISAGAGAVRDAYGEDPAALAGRHLVDLLTPDSQRRAANNFRLALDGQTRIRDVRARRVPERVLELKTAPLLGEDRAVHGVLAVTRDVTAERAAQETLRESERRYRLLVEDSADLIARQSPDGTFLWLSASFERLLGVRRAALVGSSSIELVHPDDRSDLRSLVALLAQETDLVRHTLRLRSGDGRWLWIDTVLRAIRDPRTGRTTEIVSAGRDVTQRVKAEQALQRSNAELGRFAVVASHDLSEPLLLIRAYADELRTQAADRLTVDDEQRLDVISRNADRMQSLVDALLTHAAVDRTAVGREQVDMQEVVRGTLRLLAQRIAETKASIRVGALEPVCGDARLLGVLLQNLLSNALKFCRDRRPEIDVSCRRAPGGWLLAVADNGIGIPEGEAERLFTMFARLDTGVAGFGLGLATAQRIAELHGGAITVRSELGVGSTFSVLLTEDRP